MWTTVVLVAALSLAPREAGALTLTNVRTTYGVLGLPRSYTKFLPGDSAAFAFDVEGITVADDGKVLYSIAMEVTDDDGKVKFRQAPRKLEATNSLGGNKLPVVANLQIGLDEPKGNYKVKVTVTDLASKASKSLTRSYEVLPKGFGLVRLTTTADSEGQVPVPAPVEGQALWINFGAVGFGRDKSTGQPDLQVELRVRDEDDKPTLAKPSSGSVSKDIPAKARAVPMQFQVDLNRAGKFTVELKATDKVTGEKATLSFPLTVLKAK